MVKRSDYLIVAPNSPIGIRIWFMRDMRGMTQTAVAASLNVSSETVKRWERGEFEPYPYQVEGLAKLFDVNRDWLMTGRAWNG